MFDTLTILSIILNGAIFIFTTKLFLDTFFDMQNSNVFIIILFSIPLISEQILTSIYGLNYYFATALVFILVFNFCFAIYKGSILVKFTLSSLLVTIWSLSEFMLYFIFEMYSNENLEKFESSISKLVLLLIVSLLFFANKKSGKLPNHQKYSIISLSISIITIIILSLMYYYNSQENTQTDALVSLFLIEVLLFANIITLKVYQLLANNNLQLEENAEPLSTEEAELRKLRHDIKNHLITLREYLDSGQSDKARLFIDDILGANNTNLELSNCGVVAIDSLVNAKFLIAKNFSIDFSTDIHTPSTLPFKDSDLSVILGNILDNAIEANKKVNTLNKYIKLYITYENNYLVIACINSYNGQVIKNSNGTFGTTKTDKRNHGLGINTIKEICAKYSGSATFENNDFSFTTKAILFV